MSDTKQSLRVRARLRREAFSSSELLHGNRAIAGRVLCLPVYLCSKSVALYSPIGNEVDTRQICDHALGQGKRVFYPKLSQGESCLA
ncbi:MAG: 5-formyltetrahydrofolate cyclo-ligase, partial [Candidatus Binatia bacterium]